MRRRRASAGRLSVAAVVAALGRLCLALALLAGHGAHARPAPAHGLTLEICGAHGAYSVTLPGEPEAPAAPAPLCCLAACAAALAPPPAAPPAPRLSRAAAAAPAPKAAACPAPPVGEAHRSRAPPLPA